MVWVLRLCFSPIQVAGRSVKKDHQGEGDGPGGDALMAYETLVPGGLDPSGSDAPFDFEGFTLSPPGSPAQASSRSQSCHGGASIIRGSFLEQGLSSGVADFLLGAWRESTRRQYWPYIERWLNFCDGRGVGAFRPPIGAFLDFLLHEYRSGSSNGSRRAYRTMGVIRSAVSSVALIGDVPAGTNHLVKKFMAAVFNDNPAFPRYSTTWDPDLVLSYFKSLGANVSLSLLTLSKKLVVLMRLLSGERGQTLLAFDISRMVFLNDSVTFHISSLLKTSRPSWHKNVVTFKAFPHDVDLCVLSALRCYLRITSPLRGGVTSLFLISRRPYGPASGGTLSTWTKSVLRVSGVDVSTFAAGSTRPASASRARESLSLDVVMSAVGWTQRSTFATFYHKPISSVGYSEAILRNFS